MYDWQLPGGRVAPVVGPELPDIHRTRARLIEQRVRAALAAAGPAATAIDLACNEGWFSHRMLEWGARRVVAIDIRPQVIRRAELIREQFEIPPDRLEFRRSDVFALDANELGAFDVVLCLGLVYHLENPVGALRLARALTRGLCVVESQLTRQSEEIVHGWGQSNQYERAAASYAARVEVDYETTTLASASRLVSLIPNRAALLQAAEIAGFTELAIAETEPGDNQQYVLGDRAVLFARVPGPLGQDVDPN